jgi:hypothetical protein
VVSSNKVSSYELTLMEDQSRTLDQIAIEVAGMPYSS